MLDACSFLRADPEHGFLSSGHEAPPTLAEELVRFGDEGEFAQGSLACPPRRADFDPRYRRRCAGGKRPCLGEPEALEACVATRLLQRGAHGQRAIRHAEDLRTDRPALRLEPDAEACVGEAGARLFARPRLAVAGSGEPRFRLSP